jgi:alpha-beta hydrolase superfamily lysophospholipase
MEMGFESATLQRGDANLATYSWSGSGTPRALVLILHGMAEHAARYDRLASHLVKSGFAVRAHDHRGHGRSVSESAPLGHIADRRGWDLAVEDTHAHVSAIAAELPGIPIVLLGHSMGSLISQEFLIRYGDTLSGAILSGTSGKPNFLASLGRLIARAERLRLGRRGMSKLLDKISNDDFMKEFKPARTTSDWLSRDEAEVDKYIADPLSGGISSAQLWIDLLDGIARSSRPERQRLVPSELPVFLFSGSLDPVGHNTRGVRQLVEAYAEAGLTKVEYTFYPEGRHEMLNESNREEVYADVVQWIEREVLGR